MNYSKNQLKELIVQKLRLNYGCTEAQANDGEMMKACAMVLRDIMAEHGVETRQRTAETGGRSAILCQLCNMSYVYDASFDWDPVKCTFANGTGDPAWLKRPYNRNGWDIKL